MPTSRAGSCELSSSPAYKSATFANGSAAAAKSSIRCVQALLQGVTLGGDTVEFRAQDIPHRFMPAFARIPHIVLAPFPAVDFTLLLAGRAEVDNFEFAHFEGSVQLSVPV